MKEKTFKQRVFEQADDFGNIYADFLRAFKRDGLEESWLDVFDIPLPDGEVDFIDWAPNQVFNVRNLNEIVSEAIVQLGVHEVGFDSVVYDDPRIAIAVKAGELTRDDVFPERKRSYRAANSDPIFWRTLLEILCRAFVGARRSWNLTRTIDLACDLNEIRKTLPGGVWNKRKALKILQTKEPYVSKYPGTDHQAGVGEDRIQEITEDLGSIDDEALKRLEAMFPELFGRVQHQRDLMKKLDQKSRKPKNVTGGL